MPFTPEQIASFGIIPLAEADLFNAQSAEAHLLCGEVDPAECIRIGRVAGNGFTPRELFLGSLKERIWLTPTQGNWPVDDQNNHWGIVRAVPRKAVELVVLSSTIGLGFVETNRTREAQRTVEVIHDFLSEWGKEQEYDALVAHSGATDPISFDECRAYREQYAVNLATVQSAAFQLA